jgi:hypothetical protein
MQDGTRIGRKGIDPITGIIVVIIIAMLVFTIFATANIVISTNAVRQDARETAAISVINGMDFLKRTMQEGIVYATERATYDVLAKGGYDSVPADLTSKDGTAYWRKYGQTSVPDFKAELEAAITKHFESYGTAYGTAYPSLGLGVSLSVPQYSSCGHASVTDKGGSVGVSITSSCASGLEASNEFMSITEANTNFTGDVPANAFGLVASAKAVFVDADSVLDAIKRGAAGTSCRSVSLEEESCGYEGVADDAVIGADVLGKECGNWLELLRASINSQLSGITVSGADASFELPAGSVIGDYSVGSCEVCVPQENTSSKCDGQEIADCVDCASGDCTTDIIIIGYMTTCSYSYSADADVGVALTQRGGYYPIYDATSKKTQWTRMTLRFRVLDGASQPAPTPTTSSTTTTVPRPACSSTSCGVQVSDCLCGVNVCDSGRYCCASSSGCYTSQDSCLQSC